MLKVEGLFFETDLKHYYSLELNIKWVRNMQLLLFCVLQSRSQSPRTFMVGIVHGLLENADENQLLIGCLIICLTHFLLIKINAITIFKKKMISDSEIDRS